MSKIYLEVITSKYINGTSMRNESIEYVLLDIDFSGCFSSAEIFEETNTRIKEAIKKYAADHDIMLGRTYNNAMVGTDMYQDHKYITHAFIEREEKEGYFRKLIIDYTQFIESVNLNWWLSANEFWETDGNRFFVRSLVTEGGSSF